MKVFIAVDMEGISGICRTEQVSGPGPLFEEGRQCMTQDANACVEGCFRGGAKKVTVQDIHSHGMSMLWDRVDPRVELIQGTNDYGRMTDIGQYDALILLGYHSMAGTFYGDLDHTMCPRRWQNFWLNGKKAGEFAIDAGIAGDKSVPVIMTSGDDRLCREAKQLIKGVYAAQVKTGLSSEGARLLSRKAAERVIRDTAETACRNYRSIKPFKVKKPVRMRIELTERTPLPALHANLPFRRIIDRRSFEVTGATVHEALFRLMV